VHVHWTRGRAWRGLEYHLLGLPATMLAFTVVVSVVTVTLSLAVLIVGLPVALAGFAILRWNARLERLRAARLLGAPIGEAYRPRRGGLLRRLRTVVGDPQSWKDLAWLSFAGTLGFGAATAVVTLWACALGCITLPAWYWALPEPVDFLAFEVDSTATAFIATACGAAALPFIVHLSHWLAEGQGRLARALLAPGREAALAARVDELTVTRAGAVNAAAAELGRIERDLHDGAQARLVALAMDLGMAEERFGRDPEGARELVGEAREEAKRALAELRDLARGIRPGLLAERGLGPALIALAARSPIRAEVELDLPGRLPSAVESAAWFVVSEALANAAKHSGASRLTVRAAAAGERVRIEVADDGRGGADTAGDGLTGLRRRVEALDGTLTVDSPAGGPTTVRAELPCAS
jgi:signal transduction histidine kinase